MLVKQKGIGTFSPPIPIVAIRNVQSGACSQECTSSSVWSQPRLSCGPLPLPCLPIATLALRCSQTLNPCLEALYNLTSASSLVTWYPSVFHLKAFCYWLPGLPFPLPLSHLPLSPFTLFLLSAKVQLHFLIEARLLHHSPTSRRVTCLFHISKS